MTPAAIPAHLARSTTGSRPPVLMSSRPRCSPSCSSTSARRNPVGGRWASARRASRRTSCGCVDAVRNASATGVPRWMPQIGRLSTSRDTSISAFSWVGRSIQLRATLLPRVDRAHEQHIRGGGAVTVHGQSPSARAVPSRTRPARGGRGGSSPRSRRRTRRSRCRGPTRASPRAGPGCRAPARRTRSPGARASSITSSIARRVSASSSTEYILAMLDAPTRASWRAITAGRRPSAARRELLEAAGAARSPRAG